MDRITKTPGLIHIAEQIFSNLDRNDLLQCQKVNEYWASILRKVWYNRMKQNTTSTTLSQEQQKEWMNFCEKLIKCNLTKEMTHGLNFIFDRLENSVTLHTAYWSALYAVSIEAVEIIAPLNVEFLERNQLNELGIQLASPHGIGIKKDVMTPIYWAARNGHTKIVQILAPLKDNPNAPDNRGYTPIHWAAKNGHTEIVKILIPLTDNPIHWATRCGYTKFLSSRLL